MSGFLDIPRFLWKRIPGFAHLPIIAAATVIIIVICCLFASKFKKLTQCSAHVRLGSSPTKHEEIELQTFAPVHEK